MSYGYLQLTQGTHQDGEPLEGALTPRLGKPERLFFTSLMLTTDGEPVSVRSKVVELYDLPIRTGSIRKAILSVSDEIVESGYGDLVDVAESLDEDADDTDVFDAWVQHLNTGDSQ